MHDGDLAGRTVVITGGTRGIGRMLAEGLAAEGAYVEIVGRQPDGIAETTEAVGRDRCHGTVADLGTDDGIDAVVSSLHGRHDRIDVLVNNAATSRLSPIDADDHSFARWDKVMRLNVAAPFLLTVRLLPLLVPPAGGGRAGRVINIGSIDGMRPPDHDAHAYAASKAALHHLTEMLAPKLARRGVLINAIAPSAFPSKMSASLIAGAEARMAAANPVGRLGTQSDIVGLVRFLASDASGFVNGTLIPLDGGVRLERVSVAGRNGATAEPSVAPTA